MRSEDAAASLQRPAWRHAPVAAGAPPGQLARGFQPPARITCPTRAACLPHALPLHWCPPAPPPPAAQQDTARSGSDQRGQNARGAMQGISSSSVHCSAALALQGCSKHCCGIRLRSCMARNGRGHACAAHPPSAPDADTWLAHGSSAQRRPASSNSACRPPTGPVLLPCAACQPRASALSPPRPVCAAPEAAHVANQLDIALAGRLGLPSGPQQRSAALRQLGRTRALDLSNEQPISLRCA